MAGEMTLSAARTGEVTKKPSSSQLQGCLYTWEQTESFQAEAQNYLWNSGDQNGMVTLRHRMNQSDFKLVLET